jgi:ornithine cyclodeaminase/alanine dehydrogenase
VRGLPAITGAIMALDAKTGELRAVLGADWVTATRTAALSMVAARRLADPRSASVAFIGCGVQAHSHLAAFAEAFPLTEIRAYGRGQANVDKLCAKGHAMGLAARATDKAEDAVAGADLVVSSVTLDYSIEPFLDARWLKPGAFAAITDLGIPWVPHGMSAFESIVIDDHEQEAASERKVAPPELVTADLTEIVSGSQTPRHDPTRRAAFAFRGVALGDYAAGPSHVLPTGGTARWASGLSANDFLRAHSVIAYSKEGMQDIAADVQLMADKEGLTAHRASVDVRLL